MVMQISANFGFVTNSSSMVYHFPRRFLDNPEVKTFVETYELQNGFVGSDLWHREFCSSIAVSKEQKLQLQKELIDNEYDITGPDIDVESDDVVIIYGDEYQTITSALASLMCKVAEAEGAYIHGTEYN